MANPGGASLAKSGDSRSIAEKFAEARAATRAPGLGAAAAATFARNAQAAQQAAVDKRHAAADSLAAKLRAQGLTATTVWRGGSARTADSPLRVYVKEPNGRQSITHGYITISKAGVPNVSNVEVNSVKASKAFKALKL